MNLCEARLVRDATGVAVLLGDQRLHLDDELISRRGLKVEGERTVVLGIRPEDMEDSAFTAAQPGQILKSKVDITEALGSEVMVHFGVDAPQVYSDGNKKADDEENLKSIGTEGGATFVASFNARSRVRPGDVVEVGVDTSHLHFFDPADGARLTAPLPR